MFSINRKIFFWSLYDFANSIIIANLTLYLSQWVVVDNDFQDIWYASSLIISTLLLILTAPFFGSYSDRTQKRMRLIIPLTLVIGITTILLGVVGASSLSPFPKVLIVLSLSIIIQYAYQLSLVFYDTLLPLLTTRQNYGKISGFGDGMGNLGFLLGLFVTYPFINGKITLFGESGRIQAFVPSGILFLLLAIPMLISLRDSPNLNKSKEVFNYSQMLSGLKELLRNKSILWFLVAFYFISDAVLTIQSFFPIYFQQALNFTDFQKLIAISLVLIFIVIGSNSW